MQIPLQAAAWLGDDPILDTAESPDQLSRAAFADSAARLLENIGEGKRSSVVAMVGAWGSGKSSMLNMIRSRLSQGFNLVPSGWIIVEFNPWYYSDLASLQAGFFRELRSALPKDNSWETARTKISEIGQATAPLTSILASVGFDASTALTAASKLVGGDQSVSGLTKAADSALTKADRPVLVVLDDMDRLSPDELLMVFKLLRLTGRLHNVQYLVSFDEDTLLDALTRTGLVGEGQKRRAIEYLEKMVQVRLDLPPLLDHQVEGWLNSAIDELGRRLGRIATESFLPRFSAVYDSLMRKRLDTPRSIRRFLAHAEAFLPVDARDFDFEDYLILSWIRSAEPLLYRMIRGEKAALLGTSSSSVAALLRRTSAANRREPWEHRLREAHIASESMDDVASMLSELFPQFEREWNGRDNVSSGRESPAPRVGNPDYFDRYFHFGVPDGDLSDGLVFAAYEQIRSATTSMERELVERELPSRAALILPKLEVAHAANSAEDFNFLVWLAGQDSRVPSGNGFFDVHRRLRGLGARVFAASQAAAFLPVVEAVSANSGGLSAASDWLNFAANPRNEHLLSEERKDALRKAEDRFLELLQERFDLLKNTAVFSIPEHDWGLIWDWYRQDPISLRHWLANRFGAEQWSPLDVVARLVRTGVVMGVPDARPSLSGLDFEAVERLVGLDFLFEVLAGEIAAVEESPWPEHSVEASEETRKTYALQLLRQRLEHPSA